jgi:xanthine dehydrogenase YagS FAD-binding subunit
MNRFDYVVAVDDRDAVHLATEVEGTRYVGGGTNLVDLLKLGVIDAKRIVDVSRLTTDTVVETDNGIRIAAAARNADVAADPLVRLRYPALAYAILAGASGQIRNMATVGGNLLQRTRCRYFQDPSMPCNKREPGSGCPAIIGEHHNLAILGASDTCVATHPSDMAVALSALDAVIEFTDDAGAQSCSIHDLYRSPAEDPAKETTLAPNALITAVLLGPAADWSQTYLKVRERTSFAFAIASTAVALRFEEDRIADVRIALGAVAHKPWRASTAEEMLIGAEPSDDVFRSAITEELRSARPLRENGYKIPLVTEVVVRALGELAEHAS